MVGIFHRKSHLQMDDDWGYPYFRKPPCEWFWEPGRAPPRWNSQTCARRLNPILLATVAELGKSAQAAEALFFGGFRRSGGEIWPEMSQNGDVAGFEATNQDFCWQKLGCRKNWWSTIGISPIKMARESAKMGIWLVVCLPFFIFPSQLTNIFQRGGPTTNQGWNVA